MNKASIEKNIKRNYFYKRLSINVMVTVIIIGSILISYNLTSIIASLLKVHQSSGLTYIILIFLIAISLWGVENYSKKE
jgi:hypothetical protein